MTQGNNILEHQIDRGDALLFADATARNTDFLLLHAGGETRHVWRPVMQHLTKAGLASTAYDQRGHGTSTGSTADGVETFGIDAAEMIRIHQPAIVVGASLGAFALLLALAGRKDVAPVRGLVMVDVVPAPDPHRVRRFLAAQAPGLSQSPLVDDILGRAAQMTDAARSLTLPVTLVRAGPAGPMTDREVAHFRSLCPQMQMHVVEEAGHLIARDSPTALARILIRTAQDLNVQGKG